MLNYPENIHGLYAEELHEKYITKEVYEYLINRLLDQGRLGQTYTTITEAYIRLMIMKTKKAFKQIVNKGPIVLPNTEWKFISVGKE